MQIYIGPEMLIHLKFIVARAKIFPVGNFTVSMVIVCVGSILISCGYVFGYREVTQQQGRKEIRYNSR
jgi:hypothetical protein